MLLGLLRCALQYGLPDAAAALVAACREADLDLQPQQQPQPQQQRPLGAGSSSGSGGSGDGASGQQVSSGALDVLEQERTETAREFQLYVCEVLQQL